MLAVSATGTLSLLDAAVLKRAPSSVSSCISLAHAANSSTWSTDNTALFLASAQVVHRYDPTSNILQDIYRSTSTEPISHIICKDKGTLVFSAGAKIQLLECGSSAKITQTIESHKSQITSLSFSNDHTLLAATTSNTVHVHNLTLGSHTVLKGLPSGGPNITASVFHPHARTRLLVGLGKQLLVYDTTRPSSPMKTISLNEASSGDIVAVVCSPFSKTLVVVATSGGHVGLIDLEKEKGLFRTMNVKVPLTTLDFSAEGAALYLGTEHGKLLVMDLRALDKVPKVITVSEAGCRIETMCVQKKPKIGEVGTKSQAINMVSNQAVSSETSLARKTSIQSETSRPTAKVVSSPARTRVARVSSTTSPARRLPSTSKDSVASGKAPPKKASTEKKIFSPVRDPLGNSSGEISVQIETLKRTGTKSTPTKTDKRPSISPAHARISASPKVSSLSAISSRAPIRESAAQEEQPRRSRTVPAATRAKKTSTNLKPSSEPSARHTVPTTDTLHPDERMSSHPRSASRADSISVSISTTSASVRSTRPAPSASRPSSRLRHVSPPPLPPNVPLPASRTPSPDLPDINHDPLTPVALAKKSAPRADLGVLGMGSPEVDRWIRAGKGVEKSEMNKGTGKTVGFKDDTDDERDSDQEERERERERSLSMQVSPRRPSTSWESSPVYQSPANVSGTGTGSSAHDLLRTIVKDVMYDFQRETRAQMTGLHLDLVRMGRGWKRELRELMEEYTDGINELREENRRLREENERLRRGY